MKQINIHSCLTHIAIIVFAGLLVYSNTLNVPFMLDDEAWITGNPYFRDFDDSENIPDRNSKAVHYIRSSRSLGLATLAFNYKLHGLDVRGYHIFNIVVHLINAVLVYWIFRLTFKTPYFSKPDISDGSAIALFSSLIFAVHPIQTQAVNYIVQRFATLATLFYLLSLVFYIKSRLVTINSQQSAISGQKVEYIKLKTWGYYCGSIISAILAMKTKEIALTLPIMVILYEFMFFDGRIRRRILYLIPIFITIFIIPAAFIQNTLTDLSKSGAEGALKRVGLTSHTWWEYLFTQFRVIVTYIRLMFPPVIQNLDYDYPVYHSFFELPVFLSFLLLLSIFGLGIYLFYRSRFTSHVSRFIAFGIFWFFIALSVESSVIPLENVIFEHRLYLPSAGFIVAVISAALLIKGRLGNRLHIVRKIFLPFSISIILILAAAAYARNIAWQSNVTLWEDTVSKSPAKNRPHNNLGVYYVNIGDYEAALKEFEAAIKIKPSDSNARNNIGLIHLRQGRFDDAIREFSAVKEISPLHITARSNLGRAYFEKGMFKEAVKELLPVIAINPFHPYARYNLGLLYEEAGEEEKAVNEFKIAFKMDPELIFIHNNKGVRYFKKGQLNKAVRTYNAVIKSAPDNVEAYYNLALALKDKGDIKGAVDMFQIFLRLKPDMERAYYHLGMIYKKQGRLDDAINSFQTAIRLKPDYHDAIKELEVLK